MTQITEAQRLAAKMKSYNLTSGYAWHCHKAGDELLRLEAANAELMESLSFYAEHARLCRLIHSEGDAGRNALAKDGGDKARAAIKKHGGQS